MKFTKEFLFIATITISMVIKVSIVDEIMAMHMTMDFIIIIIIMREVVVVAVFLLKSIYKLQPRFG